MHRLHWEKFLVRICGREISLVGVKGKSLTSSRQARVSLPWLLVQQNDFI
jgi:hypothetical protein